MEKTREDFKPCLFYFHEYTANPILTPLSGPFEEEDPESPLCFSPLHVVYILPGYLKAIKQW